MGRKANNPIQSVYLATDSNGTRIEHTSLQPGFTYTGVGFRTKDEEVKPEEKASFFLHTSELPEKIYSALLTRGIMSFLKTSAGGAESIGEFFDAIKDRSELLIKSVFRDGLGERGFKLNRFAKVIYNTPTLLEAIAKKIYERWGEGTEISEDTVLEYANYKLENLSLDKEGQPIAEDKAKEAQEKWLTSIRNRPEYQETQVRLFPRKPREAKKIDVEDLF